MNLDPEELVRIVKLLSNPEQANPASTIESILSGSTEPSHETRAAVAHDLCFGTDSSAKDIISRLFMLICDTALAEEIEPADLQSFLDLAINNCSSKTTSKPTVGLAYIYLAALSKSKDCDLELQVEMMIDYLKYNKSEFLEEFEKIKDIHYN